MYYAAYGSNLHPQHMQKLCPGAYAWGSAELLGFRLVHRGSPGGAYLDIMPDPSASVMLGIWQIDPSFLPALDSYEDYPRLYTREQYELLGQSFSGATEQLNCWIYRMVGDGGFYPAHQDYYEMCREGFAYFGFDTKTLTQACFDPYDR